MNQAVVEKLIRRGGAGNRRSSKVPTVVSTPVRWLRSQSGRWKPTHNSQSSSDNPKFQPNVSSTAESAAALTNLVSHHDFLQSIRVTVKFGKWVISFSSIEDSPMDTKAYASQLGRMQHHLEAMKDIPEKIQSIVDDIPNAHTLVEFRVFYSVYTMESREYSQGIKLETKLLNNCSSLRKLKTLLLERLGSKLLQHMHVTCGTGFVAHYIANGYKFTRKLDVPPRTRSYRFEYIRSQRRWTINNT